MTIFITGNPSCGKSTLIQKLLDEISDKKVSGIFKGAKSAKEIAR